MEQLTLHHIWRQDDAIKACPSGAAYMRRWTGSALVQVMACRLDGAKPLSEPMLPYCQLDSKEHISMKFLFEIQMFSTKKMPLDMSSAN